MLEVPQRVIRAFFGRYGSKTRPLQDTTFREIRDDRDLLVMAPTGSGKTEAVFVPVACRLLTESRQLEGEIGALVLSPTRALAGDLHTRMAPIFESLGLRLDVATGDRNTRSRRVTSDVLIRTPEGLDSTLCRQPETLRAVRDVVIDEIHLFLSDPRGTQLVGLLRRLSRIAPEHRRLAVSATIPNPAQPERIRLLRSEPVTVSVRDEGSIEFLPHRWRGKSAPDGADAFLSFLKDSRCRKMLGFVRSRARGEEMVAALNRGYLRGRCRVHHAGTSVTLRRETERFLRESPVGLVVATSTLEVGIDTGDVDTCILFDVPKNASSLLQRAGRAGRRDGQRRVVYTAGLFDSAADFAKMIGRASSTSAPTRTHERPWLSGCIQQCTSYVVQLGEVGRAELTLFLNEAFGMPEQTAERMLSFMIVEQVLCEHMNRVSPGPIARELFDKRSLHLTFAGYGGDRIVDETTGRTLGQAIAHPGDAFLLGGRGRRVTRVDPGSGVAVTAPVDGGTASFAPGGLSPFEKLAKRCAPRLGGRFQT